MRFVIEQIDFPAPKRLQNQLDGAELSESCDCGCNTYSVVPSADAAPLIEPIPKPDRPGPYLIFNANIPLQSGNYLDLDLCTDQFGNLSDISVGCCANSFPVPDEVVLSNSPIKYTIYGDLLED